jgi:hypothetical protein
MKYKILLKDGVGSPFGWTPELEKFPGMELREVTKEELQAILAGQGLELVEPKQEEPKKVVTESRPGKGWVKNTKGKWVRKTGAEKQTKKTKSAPVSDMSHGASGDANDSTGNS